MTEINNRMPIALSGLLPQEILQEFSLDKEYKALQIFKWISSGIDNFDEMTNVSKEIRSKLAEKSVIKSSKISKKLEDKDGTIKLQIQLFDNFCVETVLLIDSKNRKTACVSCQVGCAMKCAFCKTGTLGFHRNLSASEIVEQFLYLEKIAGQLDNIVFMGMGEPMLNLTEIRKSIEILSHPKGRNLSTRRITLSTSGIINGIYDLANNGPSIRLAVSLTTADPELRKQLMPVAQQTNDLSDLKKAIKYFTEKTTKRCTLEAALISKINTTEEQAQKLINFTQDLDVHVNLIPWNPISELPFSEPSHTECDRFMKNLTKNGVNATLRTRRGENISGACGQLGKVTVE